MTADLPAWTPAEPGVSPALPKADGEGGRVIVLLVTEGALSAGWAGSLAVDLVTSWSQGGGRTVLADAGISTPLLHEALGIPNDEGLVDALRWGVSVQRVVRRPQGRNFLALTAGTAVADTAGVMALPRWSALCEGFREAKVTLAVVVPAWEDALDAVLREADGIVILAEPGEAAQDLVGGASAPVFAVTGRGSPGAPGDALGGPSDDASGVLPLFESFEGSRDMADEAATLPGDASATAVDSWRSGDTVRTEGVPDAPESPRPLETGEPVESMEPLDPLDALDPLGPIDAPEPLEPVEPLESMEPLDPLDALDPLGPIDAPESIGPIDAPESIGSLEEREPVEFMESVEAMGDPVGEGESFDPLEIVEVRDAQVDDFVLPDPIPVPPSLEEIVEESEAPVRGGRSLAFLFLVLLVVAGAAVAAAVWLGYIEIPGVTPVRGSADPLSTPAPVTAPPVPPEVTSAVQNYSLALGAYQDGAVAAQRVASLTAQVPGVIFQSVPVEIDSTLFYRVLAGPAADSAAVVALASHVADAASLDPASWVPRWTPMAFQLGEMPDRAAAERRIQALGGLDIAAYVLAVDYADGSVRYRVFAGAFADATEASYLSGLLVERGLSSATLSDRIGRLPE